MIQKPTVLVLGAGASVDFGFPVGSALLQAILEDLRRPPHQSGIAKWLGVFGFTEEQISSFHQELRLSSLPSVDRFLEHRRDDPDQLKMGKIAIVAQLSSHERERHLKPRQPPHWYQLFFYEAFQDAADLGRSNLTIVSFNYDRSSTHFFYRALQSAYRLEGEPLLALVRKLEPIYLHGSLGRLPYLYGEGVPYAPITDENVFARAVESIRIVSDADVANSEAFSAARRSIQSAELVIFLGFGFDLLNVRRLGLEGRPRNRKYFGSGVGIGNNKRQEIRELFRGIGGIRLSDPTTKDIACYLNDVPVLALSKGYPMDKPGSHQWGEFLGEGNI